MIAWQINAMAVIWKNKLMQNKIALIIATYCGFGLSPKAPGTVGSLATLPLAFLVCYNFGLCGLLIAAAISIVIGIPAIAAVISNQADKDPKKVVIDEVAGQLLSFVFLADYLRGNCCAWQIYLFGFAFFRFFDICKMGPVKFFDSKVKNAYGVMFDDVCAGLLAAVCLWLSFQVATGKFAL
jgi:phosphatidylglycerophosphatase A